MWRDIISDESDADQASVESPQGRGYVDPASGSGRKGAV